jgi:hypothetical protein
MKKSELRELIREAIGGYSKYLGKTKGGTSDEFMQILTKIAKGEDKYEGDPEKGNKILDKANPDNVDRISRGEDPVYEDVGALMNLEGLIEYIQGLQSDTEVWVPRIFPGGFGPDQTVRRKPEQAVEELSNLVNSPKHASAEFKLTQDNPKFKKISLIISDEEMESREKAVRGAGSLD